VIPETVAASNLEVIGQALSLDPENAPDAFRASEAWMATTPESVQAVEHRMSASTFRAKYNLDATMVAENGGYAVVDGELLRVGESIDGYRLVSVAERSALFEAGDLQVELALETPADNHR